MFHIPTCNNTKAVVLKLQVIDLSFITLQLFLLVFLRAPMVAEINPDRISSFDQLIKFVSEVIGLFTDDFSIDEFRKIWKEAVVTYFMLLSKILPGETEKNNENLVQASPRFEHGLCQIQN